ncbi:MAG: hypothetical protein C4532_03295 [Candidatus Abyssobacteria bacterium SURF_17]|jgi:hypothetical protein|uniref:Uncharacterized protein n=1 Tax=Candidatus Abyssobacteria bacterium SURF_17 TaxID=2093361 RepID=A0A419F6H2_9BACT|nr:MAG: hypothetical protein C4532_03295 [Candidatus Abyssubacteria bacterium SURF_17]
MDYTDSVRVNLVFAHKNRTNGTANYTNYTNFWNHGEHGAARPQPRNRNPQIAQIHADSEEKKKKTFGNTNYTNYTNGLRE